MILFTIGYENHSVHSIFERLRTHGVRFLVDIRDYPYSRREGMSKRELGIQCCYKGIRYYHFGRLGVPAQTRRRLRVAFDESHLQVVYTKILVRRKKELAALKDLITANQGRVCLFCYEHDPARCHRSILAERLKEMIPGLIVQHL